MFWNSHHVFRSLSFFTQKCIIILPIFVYIVGPAYYHSCGYRNNYDIKWDILIDGKAKFILEINLLSIIKLNTIRPTCKNTQGTNY